MKHAELSLLYIIIKYELLIQTDLTSQWVLISPNAISAVWFSHSATSLLFDQIIFLFSSCVRAMIN